MAIEVCTEDQSSCGCGTLAIAIGWKMVLERKMAELTFLRRVARCCQDPFWGSREMTQTD